VLLHVCFRIYAVICITVRCDGWHTWKPGSTELVSTSVAFHVGQNQGVKKSANSTQTHKDTKNVQIHEPRQESGSLPLFPKLLESHRLPGDFRPRSLVTEVLLLFFVPWCLGVGWVLWHYFRPSPAVGYTQPF
jgi:hypothetical protein